MIQHIFAIVQKKNTQPSRDSRCSRPAMVFCATLILAFQTACKVPLQAEETTRPNIVLIMADDQGWGDMAYNGHPKLKTPHFDKAASECLRFDRFHAAAPVCSPTRASVLTGRHPNRMGVFKWGYPMRPQEITLAEVLHDAGYQTAHFGKWHLGSVRSASPANPGRNGFDEWLSAPNFYDNDPILSRQGKAVQVPGESSIVAAEAALSWMKKSAAAPAPFLAVVWFGSPHSPHQAVQEDRNIYADEPRNLKNFYGEITGMDRAFGMIRSGLRELEIENNTILWYCSDNGGLRGVGSTGGRGHKGQVYEGGLLVPAFLEWPARIKLPRTTSIPCNTCDIYPTLLACAGVEITKDQPVLDGISLEPLIHGTMKQRTKPMGFWDTTAKGISTPSAKWMADLLEAQKRGEDLEPHESSQNAAKLPEPRMTSDRFPGHSAWNADGWKLHRIESDGRNTVRWELYDLTNDPMEKENLADKQPERLKAMQKQLEAWLTSVVGSLNGDDYPAER